MQGIDACEGARPLWLWVVWGPGGVGGGEAGETDLGVICLTVDLLARGLTRSDFGHKEGPIQRGGGGLTGCGFGHLRAELGCCILFPQHNGKTALSHLQTRWHSVHDRRYALNKSNRYKLQMKLITRELCKLLVLLTIMRLYNCDGYAHLRHICGNKVTMTSSAAIAAINIITNLALRA